MSQTKKKHCEPLVAVWLRPSTTGPCICCKQVAEKPRGEHLKMMYVCMYVCNTNRNWNFSLKLFTLIVDKLSNYIHLRIRVESGTSV